MVSICFVPVVDLSCEGVVLKRLRARAIGQYCRKLNFYLDWFSAPQLTLSCRRKWPLKRFNRSNTELIVSEL